MPRSDTQRTVLRPWQPRFGLGALLLVILVFSVMAAAGFYFMQFLRGGSGFRLTFVLFTMATPLLLVTVIGLGRSLYDWIGRRQ